MEPIQHEEVSYYLNSEVPTSNVETKQVNTSTNIITRSERNAVPNNTPYDSSILTHTDVDFMRELTARRRGKHLSESSDTTASQISHPDSTDNREMMWHQASKEQSKGMLSRHSSCSSLSSGKLSGRSSPNLRKNNMRNKFNKRVRTVLEDKNKDDTILSLPSSTSGSFISIGKISNHNADICGSLKSSSSEGMGGIHIEFPTKDTSFEDANSIASSFGGLDPTKGNISSTEDCFPTNENKENLVESQQTILECSNITVESTSPVTPMATSLCSETVHATIQTDQSVEPSTSLPTPSMQNKDSSPFTRIRKLSLKLSPASSSPSLGGVFKPSGPLTPILSDATAISTVGEIPKCSSCSQLKTVLDPSSSIKQTLASSSDGSSLDESPVVSVGEGTYGNSLGLSSGWSSPFLDRLPGNETNFAFNHQETIDEQLLEASEEQIEEPLETSGHGKYFYLLIY